MRQSVNVIFEIIENIKETITDNKYKIIMENLMVLNQSKNEVLSNNIYTTDNISRSRLGSFSTLWSYFTG